MFADIDHSNPEVRRDLFSWVEWLASQVRLGGLRLDAIKHFSATFVKDLVTHIDQTVGRDWTIIGEYWREEQSVLSRFIDFMDGRISLFDVRLVNNFSRLSFQANADLRTVFDGTLVSVMPKNAVVSPYLNRVTFIDTSTPSLHSTSLYSSILTALKDISCQP